MTGLEFDYEHSCKTCANLRVRTRRKVKIVGCTLAPELDGERFGAQNREVFVACTAWKTQ